MIKYINDGMPLTLYKAIQASIDSYDANPDPKVVSITTLLNGPWKDYLNMNNEVEIPASRSMWSLQGSMIHSLLENRSDNISELRVKWEFPSIGMTLSGKCDEYIPNEKLLIDWKYLSSYAWKEDKVPKYEYVLQLNMLKYLFNKNKLPVETMENIYIFRDVTAYDISSNKMPGYWAKVPIPDIYNIEDIIVRMLSEFATHRLHGQKPADYCSDVQRWTKSEYVAYKPGTNPYTETKALKLFNDYREATEYKKVSDNPVYIRTKGHYTKCENYCEFKHVCDFYQNKTKKEKEFQLL